MGTYYIALFYSTLKYYIFIYYSFLISFRAKNIHISIFCQASRNLSEFFAALINITVMYNEYNHLTLTDLLQFIVDSIDEQNRTHLNQTKLAELVAVNTGFKFPDSEHKRAMTALDRAKKRCRHSYKAPLCRLVHSG